MTSALASVLKPEHRPTKQGALNHLARRETFFFREPSTIEPPLHTGWAGDSGSAAPRGRRGNETTRARAVSHWMRHWDAVPRATEQSPLTQRVTPHVELA